MNIYLVGGAVRDQLLNLPVLERDWVVVGATAEQMLALGYRPVGKDFPVFLHPQTGEEYALARTERKVAPGYAGFVFHAAPEITLEEDLQRRDLTINAIAQALDGTLIDPLQGQADLACRVLRHVSPAFAEDPVRVLRVARFAARFAHLGFTVAEDTRRYMAVMVANGEVDALVAERVWQETRKALATRHPEQFFATLAACGALTRIFPEWTQWPLDTAWPALQRAVDAGYTEVERWACLWAGLAACIPTSTVAAGLRALAARLKLPSEYQELAWLAVTLVPELPKWQPTDYLSILEKTDAFRRAPRFAAWLRCCQAIYPGHPSAQHLAHAQQAAVQVQVQDLLAQGLTGLALKSALRACRQAAILQALRT